MKIILRGRDLEIRYNRLRGSKSEAHIRIDENTVWNSNNDGMVYYSTVIEIKENALFNTGFFNINGGTVIVVDREISFGGGHYDRTKCNYLR